jgi:hypothetical protein
LEAARARFKGGGAGFSSAAKAPNQRHNYELALVEPDFYYHFRHTRHTSQHAQAAGQAILE